MYVCAVIQKFQWFLKKILPFAHTNIHTFIHTTGIPQCYVRILADVTNTYIAPDCQVGILKQYVYANFQTKVLSVYVYVCIQLSIGGLYITGDSQGSGECHAYIHTYIQYIHNTSLNQTTITPMIELDVVLAEMMATNLLSRMTHRLQHIHTYIIYIDIWQRRIYRYLDLF